MVLPLMIAVTVIFRKQARENYRQVRAAISWVNSVLAENINGVRVVQAFSRQPVNLCLLSGTRSTKTTWTPTDVPQRWQPPSLHAIDFLGALAVALVVVMGRGLS